MTTYTITWKTLNPATNALESSSLVCTEAELTGVKRMLRKLNAYQVTTKHRPDPNQPKPKSKAAVAAEKAHRDQLAAKLKYLVQDFRELYLDKSLEFELNAIGRELKHLEDQHGTMRPSYKGSSRMVKVDHSHSIKMLTEKLSRPMIITLEALNASQENFDTKLNKLIDKLAAAGLKPGWRMERIHNQDPREFSFLVNDSGREIHARSILAWGPIVRPHYRFITTERNK